MEHDKRFAFIKLIERMRKQGFSTDALTRRYYNTYGVNLSASEIRQPLPNQAMKDFSVQRELRKEW